MYLDTKCKSLLRIRKLIYIAYKSGSALED